MYGFLRRFFGSDGVQTSPQSPLIDHAERDVSSGYRLLRRRRDDDRKTVDIVIIGYGAIATYVAETLADDSRFAIRYVVCRPGRESVAKQAVGDSVTIVETIDDLPEGLTVAVDCSGHQGLRQHGIALLGRGVDLITVSNGALADAALAADLADKAAQTGTQIRLLSGAIGAIDAISAARVGGLDTVRYTGRKPPLGWMGSPAEDKLDLSRITAPEVHFEGSARQAALLYPKNANVAATVALAGIGMDETDVRLIADPTTDRNPHQIEASGVFGRLSLIVEGNPLPTNPSSSAFTTMSVVRALRDYVEPLTF